MKKTFSLLIVLVLALQMLPSCGRKEQSVITPAEGETVFYVSPNGDDTADGTFAAPLASFAAAKEKVRGILPDAAGAVTVYFRGGTYTFAEGVSFDSGDSGREDAPVSYRAYPGETVLFTGGVKLDPSMVTPAADTDVGALVGDDAARASLWKADLSGLIDRIPAVYYRGTEDADSLYPVVVYAGTERLTPAQWPNRGSDPYEDWYAHTGERPTVENEDGTYDIYYDGAVAERISGWSDGSLRQMSVYGYLGMDYFGDAYTVGSVDRAEQSIRLTGAASNFFYQVNGMGNMRCAFRNVPEEIDLPSEAFIDRENTAVYFYAPDGFTADSVTVGLLLEPMFGLTDVSHLVFDGFEIGYTRSTPFSGGNVDDLTVSNCTVAHGGGKAVKLDGVTRLHIDRCEITDLERGGIMIDGGDRETLTSSGNLIENCRIHNVNVGGWMYDPDAPAYDGIRNFFPQNEAVWIDGVGTTVSHCELYDAPQQMIKIRGNDIVIEYCELHDCVRETSDNGAIGYWHNPTFLGTVIRYNYFHDIGHALEGVGNFALYADDGSMGPDLYGNLFVDAGGHPHDPPYKDYWRVPVFFNGTQFGHVHGNVFVDSEEGFRLGSWNTNNGSKQGKWIRFLFDYADEDRTPERFAEVNGTSDIWKEHYAGTIWSNIYDYYTVERYEEYQSKDEGGRARMAQTIAPFNTNEVNDNVFVAMTKQAIEGPVSQHDNYETDDKSVFVDYEGGNYAFTEEAMALIREACPGFEALPLSEIGPR